MEAGEADRAPGSESAGCDRSQPLAASKTEITTRMSITRMVIGPERLSQWQSDSPSWSPLGKEEKRWVMRCARLKTAVVKARIPSTQTSVRAERLLGGTVKSARQSRVDLAVEWLGTLPLPSINPHGLPLDSATRRGAARNSTTALPSAGQCHPPNCRLTVPPSAFGRTVPSSVRAETRGSLRKHRGGTRRRLTSCTWAPAAPSFRIWQSCRPGLQTR